MLPIFLLCFILLLAILVGLIVTILIFQLRKQFPKQQQSHYQSLSDTKEKLISKDSYKQKAFNDEMSQLPITSNTVIITTPTVPNPKTE